MRAPRGLLDTSVFIARESGRPLDTEAMPIEVYVSVVTVAELQAGVHAATDLTSRSLRIRTLTSALEFEPLPLGMVDAGLWAQLRASLAEAGRWTANVNDLWIAASAMANGLPVVTQDDDFDVIADLGGPELIKV